MVDEIQKAQGLYVAVLYLVNMFYLQPQFVFSFKSTQYIFNLAARGFSKEPCHCT